MKFRGRLIDEVARYFDIWRRRSDGDFDRDILRFALDELERAPQARSYRKRIGGLRYFELDPPQCRHAVEPFAPTPENLKAGQSDFEEHSAGCHGLDGDGKNRFEADFYPPIPKLTGDTQKWSDGELYFIIANGISMTGMPGFKKNHAPKEIWGIVLCVRHLALQSPRENASLRSRERMTSEQHEKMMKESSPGPEEMHY